MPRHVDARYSELGTRHPELRKDARIRGVVFVALTYFVIAQRCPAARAVGRHAVVLVDQTVLPHLLEDPPAGLDVVVVPGDVGVLHIRPEADALAHARPLFHVAADALLAAFVESGDAERFDLGLGFEPQLLFDLQFDREAVGIPACFARHGVSPHGLVARDQVLEDARHHMVDAGPVVRRRWAFVEDEQAVAREAGLWRSLNALEEDRVRPPEVENAFFQLRKVNFRVYGCEHGLPFARHRHGGRATTVAAADVPLAS